MKQFSLLLTIPLLLSGCDKGPAADDTVTTTVETVTVTTDNDQGSQADVHVSGAAGSVSVNGGNVTVNAQLPATEQIHISSDFDIDGVKLYPGGAINSVNVDTNTNRAQGERAIVRFGMTAPDAPAKVADWYAAAFGERGIAVTRRGNSLSGKSKDGDKFTISLSPDGQGSKGDIRITS